MKFSMPFFVGANLTLLAFDPVVFWSDPSVKNLNQGPLALAMAVLIGDKTSSACFIVGAVALLFLIIGYQAALFIHKA